MTDIHIERTHLVEADCHIATGKRLIASMKPLQSARWQLAVLSELAKAGFMRLTPVLDVSRDVLDFTWLEASPTSTRALGCTGKDLVGLSFKQVLAECGIRLSIMAAYRSAFLEQRSRVEHVEGKDGMALHQISPSRWELTVKVTNQAAVERMLSAQRAVSQLESRDRYPFPGGSLRTSTPWSLSGKDILKGGITFARPSSGYTR